MIAFRVFGVTVHVEFSFITVCALLCSINNGSILTASLCAAVLHELSHLLTMLLLGVSLKSVSFHGCGVRIHPETRLVSYGKELAVLMSGPAANIIVCLALYYYNRNDAAVVQLALGLLNLIPCRSLDGGGILFCILSMTRLDSHMIYKWSRIISIAVVVLMTAAGFLCGVRNFTYYALMLYRFFAEFFG